MFGIQVSAAAESHGREESAFLYEFSLVCAGQIPAHELVLLDSVRPCLMSGSGIAVMGTIG